MEILFSVLISLVLVLLLAWAFRRPIDNYFKSLGNAIIRGARDEAEAKVKESLGEKEKLFDEQLRGNEKDLKSKKDSIEQLIQEIRTEIKDAQSLIENQDKERITEFTKLSGIVEQHKEAAEGLRTTTENLKRILSNNQLRGEWGQEVAEELLNSVGFIKGEQYVSQTELQSSGTRPDLTLVLPDTTKINVDVKFPFQSLQKYQETEDVEQKNVHLKMFESDVKNRIKSIINRDYINPEEGTVDFVILFIPNEMIFSFIYEKFPTIRQYASDNKVILAGPFGFTAIVRMIFQAYGNFRYQKNIYKIIGLIRNFEQEYLRFSEGLDQLGKKIDSVHEQYNAVSITRHKKLSAAIEKIKVEDATLEIEDPSKSLTPLGLPEDVVGEGSDIPEDTGEEAPSEF